MLQLIATVSITIFVILLILLIIRVVNAYWRPKESDPQVQLMGQYSPFLTWLKYRRFARMELQPQARTKIRSHLSTLAELTVIVLWALWLGRNLWNPDATQWLRNDWTLNVQSYFAWGLLGKCGACVLWNGYFNGGAPLLIDLIAAMAHPLLVFLVLLAGAINGSKLIAVAGLVMAGLAQWWWAKEMRLGLAARLWSAALAVVGGHLVARLESGLTEIVFSMASVSLIIPAVLRLIRTRERRMAVVVGVLTGLAILSGQGYMQLALFLGVCPALLILLFDEHFKLLPVWKEFVLAGVIAVLIAAIMLVPVIHASSNITKPGNTPDYKGTQAIEYQPLNLVIHDYTYYGSDALQKVPWPGQTVNYIGWIPILFALLALRLVPRSGLRQMAFYWAAIAMIYLLSSALILKLLYYLAPAPLKPLTTLARFPSLFAGISGPFLLALAAWGLDLFLRLKWPRLTVSLTSGSAVSLSLAWLVLIPLAWSIKSVYDFVQPWLGTTTADASYSRIIAQIKPASVQWVEPSLGDWGFQIAALENGIKLTNVYHNWTLKDRTPPPPSLKLTRDTVDPSTPNYTSQVEYMALFTYPDVSYASVDTGTQKIPCQATALGGNIDVDCQTDAPGQLVVYENSWSGWKVSRDGVRAALGPGPWLTAQAPAGKHRFAFRYRPWDVPLGAAITLFGIALCLWLWFRRPAKPAEPTQTSDSSTEKMESN